MARSGTVRLTQDALPPAPGPSTGLPGGPATGPESVAGEVTAWITNDRSPATHYVVCPVCGGHVIFNLVELRDRAGSKSVYCAGRWRDAEGHSRATTGGGDPHNHWHPGSGLDAGPIHERKLGDER